MRRPFKFLLILVALSIIFILFVNFPHIMAYFDDEKYVDGEVFMPIDGEYDFRKFNISSPNRESYWAVVQKSGYAQIVDKSENVTINVFEWDKMTSAQKERLHSSFLLELERPYHVVEGYRIIEIDFLSRMFYGAYVTDDDNSTLIYIATPTENETLELIKTLKFNEEE